jgi:hypothetical protein
MFRSGTTLAQVMADAHPAAVIQYQGLMDLFRISRNRYFVDHIGRSEFDTNSPLGLPNFSSRDNSADHPDLLEQSTLDAKNLAELTQRGLARAEQDQQLLGNPAKLDMLRDYGDQLSPGSSAEVLRQALSKFAEEHAGHAVIGFKDLFLLEFAPALFRSFGKNITIWNIIRDPRATYASRNYGKYVGTEGGNRRYPTMLIARMWRHAIGAHRLLEGTPGYVASRYEDLVKDPTSEFAKVTRSLGIELADESLAPDNYRDRTGIQFETNSSFTERSQDSNSSIDRWKSLLPDHEIAALETTCGPELASMGYELTLPNSSDLWASFNEDPAKYPEWLADYDLAPHPKLRSYELSRSEAAFSGAIPLGAELVDNR